MRTISTLSSELPAASRQWRNAFSDASACTSMSPFTSLPVARSSGGVPETKTSPAPLATSDNGTPSARTAADSTGTSTISLVMKDLLLVGSEPIAAAEERQRRSSLLPLWEKVDRRDSAETDEG